MNLQSTSSSPIKCLLHAYKAMFSGKSPTRINIEEANNHLQLLHNKLTDLEKEKNERVATYDRREKELREEYENALGLKEAEVRRLRLSVDTSTKKIEDLNDQIRLKDSLICELQEKYQILGDILQHKPMLENLLGSMNRVHIGNSNTSASGDHVQSQNLVLDVGQGDSKIARQKEWPRPNIDLSPTISQMAHGFLNSTKSRQFSISEDELDAEASLPDDVFAGKKPEKELYL